MCVWGGRGPGGRFPSNPCSLHPGQSSGRLLAPGPWPGGVYTPHTVCRLGTPCKTKTKEEGDEIHAARRSGEMRKASRPGEGSILGAGWRPITPAPNPPVWSLDQQAPRAENSGAFRRQAGNKPGRQGFSNAGNAFALLKTRRRAAGSRGPIPPSVLQRTLREAPTVCWSGHEG